MSLAGKLEQSVSANDDREMVRQTQESVARAIDDLLGHLDDGSAFLALHRVQSDLRVATEQLTRQPGEDNAGRPVADHLAMILARLRLATENANSRVTTGPGLQAASALDAKVDELQKLVSGNLVSNNFVSNGQPS